MSAALSAEALNAFEAYRRNFSWAKEHDAALQHYEGEFVAVDGDDVVAHGKTRADVDAMVRSRVGVYITYVSERGLVWIL